jgi:DnaJ-class molecular chaperone
MRGRHEDYYAILGVAPEVNSGELRRAYRLLALRFHPDRAGEAATVQFQRISEAYAVLSDPTSRAAYDGLRETLARGHAAAEHPRTGARRADRAGDGPPDVEQGMYEGPGGRIGWRRARRAAAQAIIIVRLSGPLDQLLERGVARRADDGVIELMMARDEAQAGGVAAIDARVAVPCPTCAGLAERHVLWCRRCEYAGTVMDDVTFNLEIPPAARDRTTFAFDTDPTGTTAPLRLRLRVPVRP